MGKRACGSSPKQGMRNDLTLLISFPSTGLGAHILEAYLVAWFDVCLTSTYIRDFVWLTRLVAARVCCRDDNPLGDQW